MTVELSLHNAQRPCQGGDAGGRVCSLDFRPNRFFGCTVEKVLADFFSCNDPLLSTMPDAFWDLTQGSIRPGLDDRILVEAQFAPELGRGHVTMTLFYRLPTTEPQLVEKLLRLLDRRSTSSGYHRFGTPEGAVSLRGSARVRTSIVGEDEGESLLMSTLLLAVRAVARPNKEEASEDGSYSFERGVSVAHPETHHLQPK